MDASGSNHTLVAGVQIVLLLPAQPVQLWLAMSHETRTTRHDMKSEKKEVKALAGRYILWPVAN